MITMIIKKNTATRLFSAITLLQLFRSLLVSVFRQIVSGTRRKWQAYPNQLFSSA